MPPQRLSKPRQAPVSCEVCRKRKLKCDRNLPCSSCTTRGLQCVGPRAGATAEPSDGALTQLRGNGAGLSVREVVGSGIDDSGIRRWREENAAVKERLRRLEEAVFQQSAGSPTFDTGIVAAGNTFQPNICLDGGAISGYSHDRYASSAGLATPIETEQSSVSETAQAYSADTQWLEAAGTRALAGLSYTPALPKLRIESLAEIQRQLGTGLPIAGILFPGFNEAQMLFEMYVKHMDALQHILYVPTIRERLVELYDADRSPSYSDWALLLSTFASIANCDSDLLGNTSGGGALAHHWLRCSLDLLDYCSRTCSPDLQTVQAGIIAMFLMYHLEGISPRLRFLHAGAIVAARSMGLHVLDGGQGRTQETTQERIIDAEVRRRVWWHLAATDWSLAICGGPQEGTYTITPAQMQVNLPRNINDDDLRTQDSTFNRPADEATSMTYYLQRIRLGHVCRDVADITWELSTTSRVQLVAYHRITTLDAKLTSFLDNSPMSYIEATTQLSPQAKQQRFTYLTIQARRCKLHMPFFLRAKQDFAYIPSRTACLESARNVILVVQSATLPQDEKTSGQCATVATFLHHLFIAATAMAMDACIHKGSELGFELEAVCQIFEQTRHRLDIAGVFLESLLCVLHKYGIRVPGFGQIGQQQDESTSSLHIPMSEISPITDETAFDDTMFEDLRQSYTEFDMQFVPMEFWN